MRSFRQNRRPTVHGTPFLTENLETTANCPKVIILLDKTTSPPLAQGTGVHGGGVEGRRAGWLVGWLVGWMVGWLVGWLVGLAG